jgi:pimeloyl-ACP methyl ester carboxylesterase
MTRAIPDDSHRFPCSGGWLQYEAVGEGDPVVFLHGFGLDIRMWDAQWPVFTSLYRAIRYDMRGYGRRSSLPDGPYSHADDLTALIDFLRARPAHLIGLSLGGRFALRLAAQEPAAVRSLTLADPALDGHAWSDDWMRRWRRIVELAKAGDTAGAKQLWLQHPLFEPAREHADVARALKVMVESYSCWHWQRSDTETAPVRPVAEALATMSIPTLVIVGERDLPDFQVIARRLATEMPNASLKVIAGSGHMTNLEAPAVFNELVLEHLQRH